MKIEVKAESNDLQAELVVAEKLAYRLEIPVEFVLATYQSFEEEKTTFKYRVIYDFNSSEHTVTRFLVKGTDLQYPEKLYKIDGKWCEKPIEAR